jgi:phospholipid-binding lipoprotein MlaA
MPVVNSPLVALVLLVGLLSAGPARAHYDDEPAPADPGSWADPLDEEFADGDFVVELSDPFERMNRLSFGFNRGLDRWMVRPMARSYGWAVPGVVRGGLRKFFGNIRLPVVAANELLQLRPLPAARTTGRFVVNTTVGLLGFFDPARRIGLETDGTGFGDTLAFYRVPSGPYLVLPVFGPSRPRDAVGGATDFLLRADTLLLGFGSAIVVVSGDAISQRQEYDDVLRVLESSSVDVYATTRVAYMMSRDDPIEALTDEP